MVHFKNNFLHNAKKYVYVYCDALKVKNNTLLVLCIAVFKKHFKEIGKFSSLYVRRAEFLHRNFIQRVSVLFF